MGNFSFGIWQPAGPTRGEGDAASAPSPFYFIPAKRIKGGALYIITIVNWEKHQGGRKGVKNPYWIRFHHNFYVWAKQRGLDQEHRDFWGYLLCSCSQANEGRTMTLREADVEQTIGCRRADVRRMLTTFKRLHMVTYKFVQSLNTTCALDKIREEKRTKDVLLVNKSESERAAISDEIDKIIPPLRDRASDGALSEAEVEERKRILRAQAKVLNG